MKRKDLIRDIAYMIDDDYRGFDRAEEIVSYLGEIGMLPPLSECKLVPDSRDGCMIHSEVKREWDHE